MRPFYIIAVISTRLISVATMLILSYLMEPREFGQYVIIFTNALLIQMILGSWLVSIANRALVTDQNTIDANIMRAIASTLLMLLFLMCIAALAFASVQQDNSQKILGTFLLAAVLIGYDVTLAVKNAAGREAIYAGLSVSRNLMVFLISVVLVLLGAGSIGPVAGLAMGTAFAVLGFSSTRSLWSGLRPSWSAVKSLKSHISFGFGGAMLLGVYILVNAPSRNIMANELGEAAAGVWALCSDVFYGPLAVVANAYALSQVRLIYLAAENGDTKAFKQISREMFEFTLIICIPYLIGSYLFSVQAATLILSSELVSSARIVAVPAAMQASALLMLYCLASIALAKKQIALVCAMVLTTVAAATLGCALGEGLDEMANFSAAGSLLAVLLWAFFAMFGDLVRPRWMEMLKLAGATLTFVLAVRAASYLPTFTGDWIFAALAGLGAFVAVAIWTRLDGFCHALPPAVRRRLLGPAKCEVI